MMTQEIAIPAQASVRSRSELQAEPPRRLSLLLLSAWCGLVAGLLDVGTIVLRKQAFDPNRLYWMSRHFVWLIPATNLGIFLTLGLCGCVIAAAWPRSGRRFVLHVLCALTLLPFFLVAFPRIYTLAWLVVTSGLAVPIVRGLESHPHRCRRLVQLSSATAVAITLILAASPWVADWIKQSRESARPQPAQQLPNVLLIVLDTVAAGHLSLYGYERPTSTTLVELAERGIRFDAAQATSSWTLPSHATMFTGHSLHELSVGWLHPLDRAQPTLAEFLAARGYATAGFIANTAYCASDSGLGRGFTRYDDYIFPELTALKLAVLSRRLLIGLGSIVTFVEDRPSLARWQPAVERVWRSLVVDRKDASRVNREFLDWLASRRQPERPFFAFLNYSDAHTPYELTTGRMHRFGVARPDVRQRDLISRWADLDKVRLVPQDLPFAVDAYDDCIADLDEQLGRLTDELGRRAVLERTWLIIVSDHGESFGEHRGVFCHGTSLYQTELHVPLLIIPPGGITPGVVVKDTVSLRDLAATIVGLLGWETGSHFSGSSLARYWDQNFQPRPFARSSDPAALAEVVPGDARYRDAYGLPQKTWPLGAVNDGDWSYIRTEGRVREELFHLTTDAKEERNIALDPVQAPTLRRMRDALDRLTGGPLLPERFNR
jgi:arylsulfatase A-like enzyme